MGIIAIGTLVAMMLFTVANVVLRAFFNRPIPGDAELIEMTMVCTGFLGVAWCALKGKHIRVDLLVSFLPKRTRGTIDALGYIAVLGASVIIAWRSVVEGFANWELDRLSPSLGIPVFPFYWITALGFGVLCLVLVVLIARSIRDIVKK